MTFWAYLSRSGDLIVRRYLGPADRQQSWGNVRHEIGTYEASDAVQARQIALQLNQRA